MVGLSGFAPNPDLPAEATASLFWTFRSPALDSFSYSLVELLHLLLRTAGTPNADAFPCFGSGQSEAHIEAIRHLTLTEQTQWIYCHLSHPSQLRYT